MPVLGSFLRISTSPAVMKNMELPGAPSRTMIWFGGKSRRFMRFTTCWHSSGESPLNSLMRCRKCCASAPAAAAEAAIEAAAAPVAAPAGTAAVPSAPPFVDGGAIAGAAAATEEVLVPVGRFDENRAMAGMLRYRRVLGGEAGGVYNNNPFSTVGIFT